MIATSLALALGVSVGYSAQCNVSSGDTPILCYTDNGTPITSPSINWVPTNDGIYYKPQISSQDVSPTFQFGQGDANLTLQSNGKGIKIGEAGNGTLSVDFQNQAKIFTLDLSNVGDSPYSFIGHITTSGSGYNRDRRFVATFGASVKGDITLNSAGKATGKDGTPNALTFNNGAKLEGNLNVKFEDTGIKFVGNGGAITGKVSKTSTGTLDIVFDSTYGGSIGDGAAFTNGSTTIENLTSLNGNISISGNSSPTVKFITQDADLTLNSQISTSDWNTKATLTFEGQKTTLTHSDKVINTANNGQIIFNFNTDITEINGEIYVGPNGYDWQTTKNTLNFNSTTSATINGNITSNPSASGTSASINAINFTGIGTNTINGTIKTEGLNSRGQDANNIIDFQSTTQTNIIKGLIQAQENGRGWNAKNKITFSGVNNTIIDKSGAGTSNVITSNGGTTNTIIFNGSSATKNEIIGNIYSTGSNYESQNSLVATNSISFQGDSLSNKIQGKITAERTNFGTATNTIEFNNSNTGGTNLIQGAITATGATNTITFSGNANSTIHGDISANGTSLGSYGSNTITFSSTKANTITGNIDVKQDSGYSATNTIHFTSGTTNTITGNIVASGGSNDISLSGTTNTLGTSHTNTILANGGTNQITATALTLKSSIIAGGNTDANNGGDSGAQGKNLIELSGASAFGNNIIIRAGNRNNTITEKSNIIKFAGTIASDSASIAELTAVTKNSDHSRTKNVLSFDGLSSPTTLTIADINKADVVDATYTENDKTKTYTSGYNYIGKGLTTGSANNGSLALNFTENNWSDNTYQADKLTLNVTESIYAKNGKNYINVGAISGNANIDGNGGTNNIATANGFQARAITARWGGANNIIVGGNATISGDVTAGGSDNNGTNNFTFKGTSATHSIAGNLIANNGSNNLTFAGGTLNTFSLGASSKINGSGNNTFNIQGDTKITSDLATERVEGSGKNIFNISNSKSLTLADTNSPANVKTLNTASGETEIVFLGNSSSSSGSFSGNVSTVGGSTTFKFSNDNGTYGITGTLSTSAGGKNIIDVSTNSATISNDLTFSGSGITGEGGNIINIGAGKTLTLQDSAQQTKTISTSSGSTYLNFNGSSGTLNGNVSTTNSAVTTFNLGALDSASVTAIISSGNTITNNSGATNTFNINAKTTTLQYGDSGLVFSEGTNNINFENTSGATLNWKNADGTQSKAISTTGGSTNINFNHSGTIAGSIETNSSNGGSTTINISTGARGTIEGAITLSGSSGANNVTFKGSNGGLILKETSALTNVANSEGGVGNAISFYHDGRSGKNDFKTLTIGTKTTLNKENSKDGISGSGLNFLVYAVSNKPKDIPSQETQQPSTRLGGDAGSVSTGYADKIVIHSSSNAGASTHHLGVVFENGTHFDDVVYEKGGSNNILVATVANSSQVTFNQTEKTILGFTTADVSYVTESTNENGETGAGYTSYYIGKVSNAEVIVAEQEITATAFTLNYDLYMANFNSLNKRMGELRENAHSQGVWARVFNGALSNNFGLGSKSNYTTIQAGYDYAFGFEGANNYLGVALSYALSTSTSNNKAFDSLGQQREIGNIYSNAVEVAIYNSYVSDMGWYNDSIAKFSYLMSSFDIDNLNTGSSTKNNTNNFALTFGDEVGYVFKLGESKEWSITPQVELTFGYFNQSDFKQTLANSMAYLASSADAVLTLRSRVGSSFAYDFKNFTQDKGINASVYVGAFYEYDYVSGGSITMSTDQMSGVENILSDISSDGRVVMNVGTNMTIKDNTRIYFDFEKSFAGKITTDYQVNVGVRYSFGESNGYTPMIEKAEFKAPLKVESESEEEVEEEASKESEANTTEQSNANESKIEEKTQSQDSKEQSNAENKVEEKKVSKEESKEGKEVSKAK